MRGLRRAGAGVALGFLVFVRSLPAVDVALTYTAVSDPSRAWYPNGWTYPSKSVKVPEGAWKLPQLVSRYPFYALVRFGDESRLCIVDRRQASDAFYNRLYFDANGNRDLTDDAVLSGEVRKDSGTYAEATFKPVNVDLTVGGKRLPFSFLPRIYSSEINRLSDASLTPQQAEQMAGFYLTSSCYYGGTFKLDGRSYTISLGDADCDGLFTSRLSIPSWSYSDGRLPQQGDWFCLYQGAVDSRSALYLSRYLAIGDSLFDTSLDIPGGKLVLTPLQGGARVRLPMPTTKLQLAAKDGAAVMAYGCKDAVRVPEGAYKVAQYQVRQKAPSGDEWEIEAVGAAGSGYVECRASGAGELSFGVPYVPRVVVYDWDRKAFTSGTRKDLPLYFNLYGKGEDLVTNLMRISGSSTQIPMSTSWSGRPKEPTYMILKTSGETVATGSFEYG